MNQCAAEFSEKSHFIQIIFLPSASSLFWIFTVDLCFRINLYTTIQNLEMSLFLQENHCFLR